MVPRRTPRRFTSDRSGDYDLYSVASDGSGQVETLLRREGTQLPGAFSADGETLTFVDAAEGEDIWTLPLSGEPSPVLASRFNEYNHDLSPDGKFIVYESNESGRYEIYVQSFPQPGAKWAVSKDGGRSPVWCRDGDEIFFQNGNELLAVDVHVDGKGALRVGEPKALFEKTVRAGTQNFRNYDASADGSRFVMIEPVQESDVEIDVVLNWYQELEDRLAPRPLPSSSAGRLR